MRWRRSTPRQKTLTSSSTTPRWQAGLKGLDELVALNPLLADFKAVKNRRAWCCEQNVYQQMTATGEVVADLHEAIADTDRDELTFFCRLT